MTFRTFDIDAGHAATNTDVTTPTRHVRSRRRALARSSRSSGVRIIGFGI